MVEKKSNTASEQKYSLVKFNTFFTMPLCFARCSFVRIRYFFQLMAV